MMQLLRKKVWWLLYKLNIELPRDPAIPLLIIHSNNENRCSNKNVYTDIHSSSTNNRQKIETLMLNGQANCDIFI